MVSAGLRVTGSRRRQPNVVPRRQGRIAFRRRWVAPAVVTCIAGPHALRSCALEDVYRRDVDLLQPGQWLNDAVINYCYRCLETRFQGPRFLFMDPSVVSFMRLQCEDREEWAELAAGTNMAAREWLFVPVNDNESFDSISSHWSLLVCHARTGRCLHFDSHGTYNHNAAAATADKLHELLWAQTRADPDSGLVAAVEHVRLSPQQTNGCDCGIYVLMVTEWLANALMPRPPGVNAQGEGQEAEPEQQSQQLLLPHCLDALCRDMAAAVHPDAAVAFRVDAYAKIVRK